MHACLRAYAQAVELGSSGHITESCYLHLLLGQTTKVGLDDNNVAIQSYIYIYIYIYIINAP